MQIFNVDYFAKLFKKHGVRYVIVGGTEYVLKVLRNFVLTPWYYIRLHSLPQQMSISTAVEFVEHDCNQVFRPLQVHSEIVSLLKYVKKAKPKVMVEIGTANGGTLLSLIKATAPQKIVSIDLPAGQFGGGYAWYKIPLFKSFVQGGQQLHLIRGDSHQKSTKQQLANILHGEQIDFLLIDGDHTYEGVKQDFEMYAPLVKKGGLIAFHDIVPHAKELNCGVDKLWNELVKQYPHQTFVENWKQGLCGIGVIQTRQ